MNTTNYIPWTLENVPMDKPLWVRFKNDSFSAIKLAVSLVGHGVQVVTIEGTSTLGWDDLLERLEYTTDGGKTWLPCGVLKE